MYMCMYHKAEQVQRKVYRASKQSLGDEHLCSRHGRAISRLSTAPLFFVRATAVPLVTEILAFIHDYFSDYILLI